MFKLKKETQFIFIALFAFLLLFEIFGYDFGTITGSATSSAYFGDLGNIMNEALTLPFESLVKPLFTTVFGADYYIYSIKILLIVVLSIIFNLGTSLLFANNKKSARWIAIIFATLGVVLIPNGALEALFGTAGGEPSFIGSLILALVILAFIIGIFVPLFKWKAQGMGNNILRGIAFLVMIPLISLARTTFAGFITGGPSFFNLALSLISLVCIIMFFVSLVRAFSGGVREATSGGDIVEGARRARESIGKGREAWRTLFRPSQQSIQRAQAQGLIQNIRNNNKNIIPIIKLLIRSRDIDEIYNQLLNLRSILNRENAYINDKSQDIINSYQQRKQNIIRNNLTNLVNANSKIIGHANKYADKNRLRNLLMGTHADRGLQAFNNVFNIYVNERKIFIRAL